jgi:hypothetical protein
LSAAPDPEFPLSLGASRLFELANDARYWTVKFGITCYLMFQKFEQRDLAYYTGRALRSMTQDEQ